MNDSTLFTLGMFAVTSLAGPVILLILFLTGRAAVRRGKDGARPGGPPRPVAQFGCGLLLLVPVCAFGGIMVASAGRSEEHTSELQSLMRHSYAVFCLKKKKN